MARVRKIRIGVIAAAGKGTRAYPRTSFVPKPLFLFENQTILERNVALQFNKIGVQKIFIIVGHLQDQVIEEVDRIRAKFPDKSIETVQWTQKGLAADVASLRDRIDGDFSLILGDEFYYDTDHQNLKKLWAEKPRASSLIAVLKSPLVSEIRKNYSVILKGTRVRDLVEKPETPPNDLLGLGSYVFTPEFFKFYDETPPSERSGVVELTDVIQYIAEKKEVHALTLKGRYFNINSLADYYATNYMIRSQKFEKYRISLIIPALNNQSTLTDVINDFEAHVDEIVVVDQGSTDKTIMLAKAKKVKLLKNIKNSADVGLHQAESIYRALSQAAGDILVLCPADGSFRAGDLPKLLEYLKDCDMAVGTRTTRQMMEQGSNLSARYRWLNVFFGKFVEIMWWGQEPRFTDIGCLYRAIWKDSFLKIEGGLKSNSKTYSLEMMLEIMRYHMRCIEVPVSFYRRYGNVAEDSLGKRWHYFFSVLWLILSRRFTRGA